MADEIDEAITRINDGATADACETPTLDFKQDVSGSNGLDALVARAAVCFANAAGGSIVIGVSDKAKGPDAITGTLIDSEALRQRILELTKPPLMTEIEVRKYSKRVLVVKVPSGTVVYADTVGRSWQRVGKNCIPLQPQDMARLSQERSGFDWSAQPSGRPLSDVLPDAIHAARSLLANLNDSRRELARHSDPDLLRALGVTCDDGEPIQNLV
jgi:ATP-dependent DNA helicase RecG